MNRHARCTLTTGWLALAMAALAGCGGGGESTGATPPAPAPAAATSSPAATASASPSASTVPAPTEAPTMVASVPVSAGSTPTEAPTTAPAPAPAPTSPGDCGLVDLQAQVLADLNRHRAAGANCGTKGLYGPATAVTWNALLETAALRHSQDMADKNYFSHVSANGNTLQQRIDATGYAWMGIGENIAASYGSVSDVVTAWIDSDGHCANMMNPNFAEIGLACVRGTSATTYRNYWTLNFGTPPKKAQSSAR